MFVPAAASSASSSDAVEFHRSADGAAELAVAFTEPARVAAGWADQPPVALVVLFALTLVLFALSHRQPGSAPA